MSALREAIGVVENGRVVPPPEVRLPEGARVRVSWEEAEGAHPEPLEREPLTEEDIRGDLEWATRRDREPLTPEYLQARERLRSLVRPDNQARRFAWDCLLRWRRELHSADGPELPAPWLFSDEEGRIEFEWHLPLRHLVLTLPSSPEGACEYGTREETDGTEVDAEGEVAVEKVTPLIRWVLSMGWTWQTTALTAD